MVKPIRNTTPSKTEKVVEQQMVEQQESGETEKDIEGKVEIDTNSLKKNKQFNQYVSTDRSKEVKKNVKINPGQKRKKQKIVEKALNRVEKDQVFLEKKSKKIATKKKWNSLY